MNWYTEYILRKDIAKLMKFKKELQERVEKLEKVILELQSKELER